METTEKITPAPDEACPNGRSKRCEGFGYWYDYGSKFGPILIDCRPCEREQSAAESWAEAVAS